jgi:molybdate transport system substrate-binding protein
MKKIAVPVLIILLVLSLVACSGQKENLNKGDQNKTDITISAAASLNNVLTEIRSDFEKKNDHIHLLINLGGSGALQQQIIQGAPVDLFISAAEIQFGELIKNGFIKKQDSTDLLGNKLVLITNKESSIKITGFSDLQKRAIKEIAIGTPETVPAGMYAKQTLQNLGMWEKVQTKIIPTKDVRQVLNYVETGNVDAGIVYMTDAKISDKVKVVSVADEQTHDPIVYPAGIIKESLHHKEALQFYHYLKSKPARIIFEKYGFKVLD